MKTPILLFFLFIAHTCVSQEVTVDELTARKTVLQDQITVLRDKITVFEDSLSHLEENIASLKKQENSVLPDLETNELLTSREVKLRSGPNAKSTVLLTLEKNSRVLKIDKINNYFLVCFQGTCGYVPTKDVKGKKIKKEKTDMTS